MKHPEFQADLFPVWTTLPIRFRDLDPLNHVNNAIFSTMFEEARIDFIRQVPGFRDKANEQESFVIVNLNIDFVSQLQYPAEVLIGSGIMEKGNTSIRSFQAIYHYEDKRLVATAQATGVWFDLQKQRPTRLPDLPEADEFMIDFE
ncbi:MAG: acyl-CoA thioesterase [Bacteroidota bacterium]